ncbi:MAG: hypothetical protein FWC91_08170 [Defluviitaleaceae bacterium]|nr:hypothetical protein [Defluviitaleaceae bacterium]
MIEQDKSNILTNFLMEDVERAKKITTLSAEEALKEINNHCECNFTLDELVAYSKIQAKAKFDDELGHEELDQVAGGGVFVAGYVVIVGASAIFQ